jgi:hypothetical protein
MMKFLIQFSILFFVLQSKAQQNDIIGIEKQRIAIKAEQFWGFDAFGYYYYSNHNVLFKQKEKEIFQYKNLTLGTLNHLDLENPLRLLLYFETFNRISTLDNQLNEIQTVDFSNLLEPLIVTAIGMASQNQLWCFDILTQKILLFNLNTNMVKPISVQLPEKIKVYQGSLNYFYYVDLKNKAYEINMFGKIKFIGNLKDCTNIRFVSSNSVIFQNNEGLFYQDFSSGKLLTIKIAEKTIRNFTYQNQILSIFTNNQIINYSINIP